jgi:hypothetical protein
VIARLSPNSAAAGGASFTLTVTGTNFVPGMNILWGTTWVGSSCAVISATKFVCTSQTDPAPSVEVIEQ